MVICRGYPAGECPPKSEPRRGAIYGSPAVEPLTGAQKVGSLTLAEAPPQLPICGGNTIGVLDFSPTFIIKACHQ